MKKYKQLTSGQRYQIYGLKQAGLKQGQIAEKVGVDKSTISREFRRNKGQRGWRPKQAQSLRDERKQACLNGKRFSTDEWAEVERLIRTDSVRNRPLIGLRWKGDCRSAMRPSTSTSMRATVMEATCASICADRNRIASVMRAGKSGGA